MKHFFVFCLESVYLIGCCLLLMLQPAHTNIILLIRLLCDDVSSLTAKKMNAEPEKKNGALFCGWVNIFASFSARAFFFFLFALR